MNISWLGHSMFKIGEKIDGKEVVVVTDPYDKEIGLFPPKVKADVVTISHGHHDHNYTEKISGNLDDDYMIFDHAGEYETRKVFITGIESIHDDKSGKERGLNTIFRFEIEGMVVVHLGDLGDKLTEEQVASIGDVDILLIPVGGKYTIDGEQAAQVVRQIEPRIVIPMHYQISGLKIDIADESRFIKEMGGKVEKMAKLKIMQKDLPEDDTKVIILEKE